MKKATAMKATLLSVSLAAATFGLIGADAPQPAACSRIAVPPMARAPAVDGVIKDDEWRGAAKILGTGTPLEPRQCTTWFGYDANNFYIAMSSELPPDGKLISEVKRHDQNTCHDDSIEIWIDPNRPNRSSGKGDLRYFQIIINSLGTVFDTVFDQNAMANNGWTLKDYAFKSSVNQEKKTWDLEFSLPWKSLDANFADLNGKEFGMLVARNWKRPWSQLTVLKCGGFPDFMNYAVFALRPDAPVIQEKSFGNIYDAKIDYQFDILNGSAAELALKAKTDLVSSDMPPVSKQEDLKAPAKGVAAYKFATNPGYLHKTATHTVTTTLSSADGKEIYFQRQFTVAPPREKTWMVAGSAEEASACFIAYYPAFNKLAVKVDLSNVEGAEKITSAEAEIFNDAGKSLAKETFPFSNKIAEKIFEIPDLPNGTYTVKATLKGESAPAKPFENKFVREHFPWEDNILGITDDVPAPFIPIKTDDDSVEVVLRKMEMNEFGLWDSVISEGKELLAAPMSVEYSAKGKAGTWEDADGSFTKCLPAEAIYESTVASEDIVLKTRSTSEFDGCMKVEMEVQPMGSEKEIDKLVINIPLKNELAPLWHVMMSSSIRQNPSGSAPAGEGLIWDSTKTGHGAWLGSFLPYIWLGGPGRGLAWFANNDKGWSVDDNKPCLELWRKGGVLTLKINLISRPTKLDKPRTIVFGLQASPTKPLPRNWRSAEAQDMPAHGGSNGYWGILPHFAGKYPAERDYSFADELLISRRTGWANQPFLKKWIDEKLNAHKEWDKGFVEDRTRHFGAGIGTAVGRKSPMMLYFEEHFQDQSTPEWHVFQDQWGTQPFTKRSWAKGYAQGDPGGCRLSFQKSYQDFACYYAMQWYLRGMGIYCDNTYLHDNFNPMVSDAYVRDDGQIQPSSQIWELRAYHKRLWTLKEICQKLTQYRLLVNLHMTNGNLLPIITWADVSLVNEWGYKNATEPWPPDIIQTEMTGFQTGNFISVCLAIMGNDNFKDAAKMPPERLDLLKRAEWGVRRIHEMIWRCEKWQEKENQAPIKLENIFRAFGYGDDNCTVIHYWDKSAGEYKASWPDIKVSQDKVKWIGLWKPAEKKLMMALFSYSKEPLETEISAAKSGGMLSILGPQGFNKCTDAETGKDADPGKISLAGWGVRIIEFK